MYLRGHGRFEGGAAQRMLQMKVCVDEAHLCLEVVRQPDLRAFYRLEERHTVVLLDQGFERGQWLRSIELMLESADQRHILRRVQLEEALPAAKSREQIARQRQAGRALHGTVTEQRRQLRLDDTAVQEVATDRHPSCRKRLCAPTGESGNADVQRAAAEVEHEDVPGVAK